MYFGSVRFFKHLILVGLGLMIVVPITLCGVFGVENYALRAQAAEAERTPSPSPPSSTAGMGEAPRLPYKGSHPRVPSLAPEGQFTLCPGGTEGFLTAVAVPPEAPAYQSLYPDLYAPEAARGTVDEEKTVYLTFDDGPSAQTPKILEILERYNVKATFFVVGREDEQSGQWMRDIVAAGHTLGMHSYSHDYEKIYTSVENFLEDYDRIFTLIKDTTGVTPSVCRFPGGSINGYDGPTYREIIAELVRRGFVYFDWNVATGDAAETGLVKAAKLEENALSRVESLRRSVVLMHDSAAKSTTVEALPAIIEGYRAAGFTFAPLTAEVAPVIYMYPD